MRKRVTPDPSITPLVDVLLILLCILLASIPVLHKSVAYELPKAGGEDLAVTSQQEVLIQKDGTIITQGVKHSLVTLKKQGLAVQPTIIKAEADVSIERVLQVGAILKEKGITQLIFATQAVAKEGENQ